MAVYTEVGFDEADQLVQGLGLGALTDLRGIRSGIENTNYYANTARGQWVLTIFERLSREQLPYYLQLMQHLALQGIPVPAPQAAADGTLVHTLAGKPAAVVTRLPGSHRMAPDALHCEQVGEMLARMHRAGSSFAGQQPHLRGLAWWAETVPEVLPHLAAPQAALLRDELVFQQTVASSAAGRSLPRGPVHADLFRDNVMFDATAGEDRLCGFFDFYFAGTDALLFDIAVCLNDWAIDHASGRLVDELAVPFLAAYQSVRLLTPAELRLLPALLAPKDPTHFERVLRERIDNPWHPPL
jgi:homoserine kinase type II